MSNTTTVKQLEGRYKMVNDLLATIGSKYRFGIEHPWSKDFLALTDNDGSTWIETFAQSTKTDQYNALTVVYDILSRLQQEGVIKQ